MERQPFLLVLCVVFLCTWQGVKSVTDVYIRAVELQIHPTSPVASGTDVFLECRADISHSSKIPVKKEYVIFMNGEPVFKNETNKVQSTFIIPGARVAQSGKYHCRVTVGNDTHESTDKRLTVEGLQTPVLSLSKTSWFEGEEVTATCSATRESASQFFFYFYENLVQVKDKSSSGNKVAVKLKIQPGQRKFLSCKYFIMIPPDTVWSDMSERVEIHVEEMAEKPSIEVWPESSVVEGDFLNITCAANINMPVFLSKGDWLVSDTKVVTKTLTAQAEDAGSYTCAIKLRGMGKSVTANVSVAELFSKPLLTMNPQAVFEKERVILRCTSKAVAESKIKHSDVTYTFYRGNSSLPSTFNGQLEMTAHPSINGNYSCRAQVKGIQKQSVELIFRARELVSDPEIQTDGAVILGRSFRILCQSEKGQLPIHYTLLKGQEPVDNITVSTRSVPARFSLIVNEVEKNLNYTCQAENNGFHSRRESLPLPVEVIVPPSKPLMTGFPDVKEGNEMTLICGIQSGSFPITFSWYRVEVEKPIHTTVVDDTHSAYQLKPVGKEHSGKYYCKAANVAEAVNSDPVLIKVKMADWKKGVIVSFCLLFLFLVAVGILGFVLYCTKRGHTHMATELSVKPSSPKPDDSVTVSLTHDTDVYNSHKAHTDVAEGSVWIKRTSCSGSVLSGGDSHSEVEYTEVIHPQTAEPCQAPLRKGTETVYSELQNSSQGAEHHTDREDAVEYAQLNHSDVCDDVMVE